MIPIHALVWYVPGAVKVTVITSPGEYEYLLIIKDGPAVVLLDGLDETPTRQQRECISELVSRAARDFGNCRFVVTSRPPAFEGKSVLPDFRQVWIDPLEDEAVEGFLSRWCHALFLGSDRQAQQHLSELLKALRSAAELIMGRTDAEVERMVGAVVEGSVREVAATHGPRELDVDRREYGVEMAMRAQKDLNNIGIEIRSFHVIRVIHKGVDRVG